MELLAPSEYSGILEGGINGTTWVDFSPQGLKRFCHTWENDDGGSTDPRFQCYVMPYADWFEGHGRFVPTRDKPLTPGVAVWWYTPEGFIHHTLSEQERLALQDISHHPANERDIWAHLISLWPDMTQYSPRQLTYGGVGASARWRAMKSPGVPGTPCHSHPRKQAQSRAHPQRTKSENGSACPLPLRSMNGSTE